MGQERSQMDRTKISLESAPRGCGQRRQGMVSRLQRADAQASWMGARTKAQILAWMHPDTPRKWKLRVARGRGVPPGRPRALPADVLADLASTACRICTRVPISSPVMAVVFDAQLKALEHLQWHCAAFENFCPSGPHVKLVYMPANFTAVAHPLDRAFMRHVWRDSQQSILLAFWWPPLQTIL